MRKQITILYVFLIAKCLFAEINLQYGTAATYSKNNIENDIYLYDFSGLELQIKPSLNYFPNTESKIGFGLNVGVNFLLNKYTFVYKNDSYNMFQKLEIIWYNETYVPAKDNGQDIESTFSINPTITYRTPLNEKGGFFVTLGPTYTLELIEYYYAKKEDAFKIQNWYFQEPRTAYHKENVNSYGITRNIFSIEGQIGYYYSPYKFIQDVSCYFRLGNLEISEMANKKIVFTPSFAIGIMYKLGYSFDTKKEHDLRIEKELQQKLEAERQQQEYYNQLLAERQKQLNEQHKKIKEKYGDKDIINLDRYTKFSNPYAFDMNVIYYLEDQLFVHKWLGTGFVGGTIPKEALVYDSNNQIYIAYIPEKSKVNTAISNVYLQYIGTEEFITTLGGTVILPKFMVLQYN